MDDLDTREWLLTNGLGSFASGTVCDAHTRTYHGWLFAALDPPGRRTLLLARIDAVVQIARQQFELGTNFWVSGAIAPTGYTLLKSFGITPVPTWVWGGEGWQLTRQILLPYGWLAADTGQPQFLNRVLIRYTYEGRASGLLKLRPLISDRDFHYQQHADGELQFSQVLESNGLLLQAIRPDWVGTPWQLCWTQGDYHPDAVWYWSYRYPEETKRGLRDSEDLYSPGYLTIPLQPGETLTLEARVGLPELTPYPDQHLHQQTFAQAVRAQQQRLAQQVALSLQSPSLSQERNLLWQQLLQAGDQFIVYRASIAGSTVIAGYPWFNDWGRDTLIALPGLALKTRRFSLARALLKTFGHYCQDGLLPNTFPHRGIKPLYNSLDASLWWVETLGLYVEATQDWEFLKEQYPVVRRIYKALVAGTIYNIRLDAFDGLLTWDAPGVALTWMDIVVDGEPITPRRGKPVEINALWYSALCWAKHWAQMLQKDADDDNATKFAGQAHRYAQQAAQVKMSLQKFWNSQQDYLYDVIAPNDRPDPSIRPNAIIALSLAHCGFTDQQGQRVLQVARDRLLTPYGLRSLDPTHPDYVGSYTGDMWHRDRAYHQGTVWSWLIGPFIRAWRRFWGTKPLPIDWEPLLSHFRHQACLGSISEIFDGDPPHAPQGAIAQAWSVAELIRHWEEIGE
jgi:4-alpha-glucanotransferase